MPHGLTAKIGQNKSNVGCINLNRYVQFKCSIQICTVAIFMTSVVRKTLYRDTKPFWKVYMQQERRDKHLKIKINISKC